MNEFQVAQWIKEVAGFSPRQLVRWAHETFAERLALATGLGAEDQLLTHLVARNCPETAVFFVDTGRHFQQTHDLLQETIQHYGIDIKVLFPRADVLEAMLHEHGPNLFHQSAENRIRCCSVRKHDPLHRALAPFEAVLSGRRQEQAPHRTGLAPIEWDQDRQLVRVNPLWNWREKQVWDYIRLNHIPTHELHQTGYAFPGCAPCTRGIKPGESFCAGRWWWEQPQGVGQIVC